MREQHSRSKNNLAPASARGEPVATETPETPDTEPVPGRPREASVRPDIDRDFKSDDLNPDRYDRSVPL